MLLPFILALRGVVFSPDSRQFFSENNRERQAIERLEQLYGGANTVVFVLATQAGDIFTASTLRAVQELTEAAWKTPGVSRVESLANFPRTTADGEELRTELLFRDAGRLATEDLDRIRAAALGDRELVGRIVAAGGDATAIFAYLESEDQGRPDQFTIAAHARAVVAAMRERRPDLSFGLTGTVLADVAFAEAAILDAVLLVPLMLGVIAAALWLAFRSITATLATLAVVVGATVLAMGSFIGAGNVLNATSASAPVVIMTICILDATHVITGMTRGIRAGLGKRAALLASLRENNVPMFITSLTDMIGFLVLNFADAPPIRDLGNTVSLGALAGYALSVSVLPALLMVLPTPPHRSRLRFEAMMGWFAEIAIAFRRRLLVGVAMLTVLLGAGLNWIVLDDDFIRYFDQRFDFRRGSDLYQQRVSGLHMFSFPLPAGEARGVSRPEYLEAVDRFAAWYRNQDKVAHVLALSDVVRRVNRNMHDDDPAFDLVPEDPRLSAQLLLLYELAAPEGWDLRTRVDVSGSYSLVSVILRDASSAEIQALGAAGVAWLRMNAPAYETDPAGLSTAYASLSSTNIRMMLYGTFVGLTIISLTMFLVIRNARLALLSLVPNLVPAVMAYGLWGHLVSEVNLAVAVVASFTFGIIVDDTVHFVTKFHEHRRTTGAGVEAAVRHSLLAAGLPAILASAVLAAGFAVLTLSGFAVSSTMGALSLITISFGLVVELMLLPPLLLLFAAPERSLGPRDR